MNRWNAIAYYLSVAIAVVSFGGIFRGTWQIRYWLLTAFAFPVVRLATDPDWKRRVVNVSLALWRELGTAEIRESRLWLASIIFVAIPVLLLYSIPRSHTAFGDSYPVIPTAVSIVHEGNLELSEFWEIAPQYLVTDSDGTIRPYFFERTEKGIYSSYPSGMVPLVLPSVLVSRLLAAELHSSLVVSELERWNAMLIACFCLMSFFRLGMTMASPGAAWFATVMLMAGSSYSTILSQALWQHGGVILGLMALLLIELDTHWRCHKAVPLIQAIAIGVMFACRFSSGLIVIALVIWIATQRPVRAVRLCMFGVMGIIPWCILHQRIYHHPLGPGHSQAQSGNWHVMKWEEWLGVLFSPARGLLPYHPWILLAVAGTCIAFRVRKNIALHVMIWMTVLIQTIVVSCWWCWWGGVSWGPRLLTDVLPLLAIASLPAVERLTRTFPGRIAMGMVILISFIPHVLAFAKFYPSRQWWMSELDSFWLLPRLGGLTFD